MKHWSRSKFKNETISNRRSLFSSNVYKCVQCGPAEWVSCRPCFWLINRKYNEEIPIEEMYRNVLFKRRNKANEKMLRLHLHCGIQQKERAIQHEMSHQQNHATFCLEVGVEVCNNIAMVIPFYRLILLVRNGFYCHKWFKQTLITQLSTSLFRNLLQNNSLLISQGFCFQKIQVKNQLFSKEI